MRTNNKVNEQAKRQAMFLYQRACQKDLVTTVRSFFNKEAQRLQHLEDHHANGAVTSDHLADVQSVPITRIKGSVSEGRTHDFDAEFRPLKQHNKDRWLGLAAAKQQGVKVPPVGLVKVGEDYFVRDGHHRISVARAMEQAEIRANVTVWHLPEAQALQ